VTVLACLSLINIVQVLENGQNVILYKIIGSHIKMQTCHSPL